MMTALIGGSLLLVVGSAVALAMGWSSANESLLYTSIGTSLGAFALLIAAWLVGRRSRPEPIAPVEAAVKAPVVTEKAKVVPPPPAPAPQATPKKTTRKPKAKPSGARATRPAKQPSAPEPVVAPDTGPGAEEVIAIPDRKRFHRPDCRYATARGAERMSKASARRRAYSACGICKP